jgi:type I restriction enzyme R subunit
MPSEAFSRVRIDAQLADAGWDVTGGRHVRFEHVLTDGTRADYVLCDRQGRALAVLEAKRASRSLGEGEGQGVAYAQQLQVPFVFLANGNEVRFRDLDQDAHFREVAAVFAQDDLERRLAARTLRQHPIDVAIDPSIINRDYQRACVTTLGTLIAQGRRKLLVEMATGTGKTRTAAALIKRLFDANWITRALFVVDRVTLATQTDEAFQEHLRGIPVRRVPRTGTRFDPAARVVICTLQTLINEYRGYSAGYFDLIVIDECHRSIYGEYRKALDHFDAVKIGLTATPLTGKRTEDFDDEDDRLFVRDTLRFFEVDKPDFTYTLAEAVADGYLAPYRIYRAQTVKTAAEGGFEVKRDEIDWTALDAETREDLEAGFGDGDTITVDPSALERRFTIPERNRAMVREFKDVLTHGFVGRDGVRRIPIDGKTIVFAFTKRHAETLARMLDETFADRKPSPTDRYADFVISGMGGDDTPNAHDLIKRFKKEKLPAILVSVNMLDTGFDAPEVVNLIMARYTKSGVLYRQMRGRGSRLAPHIKKDHFTIFDFVGNCDAHGDDDVLEGGLILQAPKPPKPPTPRKLITLDVHDEIDPATRELIDYDPDGTPRAASADELRAANLVMRFEAFVATWETKTGAPLTAEQSRLVGMIAEQIRSNAATLTGFDAWRLTRPPFSLRGGVRYAETAFGGPDKLATFLAWLNAAVFNARDEQTDKEEARQ